MHRFKRKHLRIALISLISLLIIAIVGGLIFYSKREAILQKVIGKATAKAKNEYNLDVKIGSAHFSSLSTVAITDLSVIPEQRDSLLHIALFSVKVKILPLLFGDVKLSEVKLSNGRLNLTSKNGVKNFDFLFKKKKDTSTNKSKLDLAAFAHNLMNQILYKIPDNLDLKNFEINFREDENHLSLYVENAMIDDGQLLSTIKVDHDFATWHLAGKLHPSDKEIDVRLYADGKKVELPIIEKKYGLKLSFDTIGTQLIKEEHRNKETRIYGSWSVKNLLLNHPKIAGSDIVIPAGSIDANVFIGANYISLDSTSVIHLENISANPYIKYTLNPVKIYELKLHTDWMKAQDLFNAFPPGLFESLEGMQVSGKLKYDLDFLLNSQKPDQVVFKSAFSEQDFKILKYGNTDLSKINSSFIYTPYEYGKPMRPIVVGPKNPNFTPLDQIPSYLKNAVMTAEDPSFYSHKGFVVESIRKSVATNFKEKSFKRGGSTISMQLVKNIFLSRQKTILRKIEEILIVWLMENNKVSTKNRMLEVYFNVIEWGRNVYGVGEAAHYYFGKAPAELTLGESIYLASIVPKPKSGLYAFTPDGGLKNYLHGYFNLIGGIMARRGLTSGDSSAYGFYGVRLKESLRQQIAPVDSALSDSLMFEEEENGQIDFLQRIFGNTPDTVHRKEVKIIPADTVVKTPKEIRQEKREDRRREREKRDRDADKGLF